jgi:GT2 family glycosyltransferase
VGSACARNLGGRAATGDIVVFSDAHILAPEHWWEPLTEALDQTFVGAVSPVISVMGCEGNKGYGMRWKGPDFGIEWLTPQTERPHPVGLVPGAFLAMRSEVFRATGGFDEGMILWGMEDSELSLRFWLLGYELRVVPGVEVAHLFRRSHPYTVGWAYVIHNMLRLAYLHFKTERIERVIESLKRYRDFSRAMSLLSNSDVRKRREFLGVRCSYNDDWFFERFPMNL